MKSISDIKNEYDRNRLIRASILDGNDFSIIVNRYGVKESFVKRLSNDEDYRKVQKSLEKRIERVEDVSDDFKEGMTLDDLSNKYKTTRQNISRMLRVAGVDRSEGGISKIKENRLEKLKEYHDRGYTIERISKRMGLEEEVIRNYAYGLGLELNSETKERVSKLVEDILSLRSAGKTQSTISEVLGISQSYVSKILLNNDARTFKSPEEYMARDKRVLDMYDRGLEVTDIMKKMSLSEANVRRILYKFKDEVKSYRGSKDKVEN